MTRPRSATAATGVRKSFGDHVVLDGIDFDVAEGSILALLGLNGAGRTTLVQILSTLIGPDPGELRVAGHDLVREPDAVGAAIGAPASSASTTCSPGSITSAARTAAGARPSCSTASP